MVTLASTIEELDFEERLDLINMLWDSLASDPAAAPVNGSRAWQLRRWLDTAARYCDPDADDTDDEFLAGIAGRV